MNARSMHVIAGLAMGTTLALSGAPGWAGQPEIQPAVGAADTPAGAAPLAPGESETLARIDVVFVLDTTGSMGGLIEGAKAKIWAIANQIATAQPRPEIRMGLVGYRDRGDAYVTRVTGLTEDLDTVYADLMRFEAGGGGDGPESVNQALHEAVHAIEWSGSDGSATLRLIYLVGDAPPHMDYEQDTPYADSCRAAVERGIIINAIQCGSMGGTESVWREIASLSEGEYFAIEQSGGVAVVETSYDAEIAELNTRVLGTMIDYGDDEVLAAQSAKRANAEALDDVATRTAAADRALYLNSSVGVASLYGRQELVNDVQEGRVRLEDVPEAELPEPMRSMTNDEREAHVAEVQKRRGELVERIHELGDKRAAYITKEMARLAGERGDADGFDARVGESLRRQAARVGIRLAPEG